MSLLWFAVACLALAGLAESQIATTEGLAAFIQNHLVNQDVINGPLRLRDVKGDTYTLSGGQATFKNLQVTVDFWNHQTLEYSVTGDATCNYQSYSQNQVAKPAWTSSSAKGRNRFFGYIEVRGCEIEINSLTNTSMDDMYICETCGQQPSQEEKMRVVAAGLAVDKEVTDKITKALRRAAKQLTITGSGINSC